MVADLSGGLRRRLTLARALVHKPRLLILDEPTTGLDPQARLLLWDKIRELRNRFVTVLLSTHDMDEAEALCPRLAVMDGGQIVVEGAPGDLLRKHLPPHCLALIPNGEPPKRAMDALRRKAKRVEQRGEEWLFFGADPIALRKLAVKIPHRRIRERPADLEDLFVALTGRDLRE